METGKTSFRVKASQVQNNSKDEFVTIGPKDGRVTKYVQQISNNSGYQALAVTRMGDGMFQLADSYHRMQVLRILGYKYVQVIMVN